MKKRKCVFLDRDGVLNQDIAYYTFKKEDFKIAEGVPEAISLLKQAGFLLIIITNQAGISKGLYSKKEAHLIYDLIQKECNYQLDGMYYAPFHPKISSSLMRKPNTLMFEKAIAKFNIDIENSWMVGDKITDLEPAYSLGVKNLIYLGKENINSLTHNKAASLSEGVYSFLLYK